MSDSYDAGASSGATVLGLLRNVGGWSKPSGRGWFMFRCLTTGTSTAAMLGVTAAFTIGSFTGAGMMAFLFGSCIGFAIGSSWFVRITTAEALYFLRKHPRLMQHHLERNFPTMGYDELDLVSLVRREREAKARKLPGPSELERELGGWARMGQYTSAYQTAQGALAEVDDRVEAALVAAAAEQEIQAGVDDEGGGS